MKIDPKTGIWIGEDRHQVYDLSLAECLLDFCVEQQFNNVVDLGCGAGFYVKHLISGNIECKGYDGNPYTPEITNGLCQILDLSELIDIGMYDCVISLEVGEHIPRKFQEIYINNLLKTAKKYLILSWAIPGQGGVGHFNERPHSEIIEEIEKTKIWKLDNLTSQILRRSGTLPWFKNTILCFKRIK